MTNEKLARPNLTDKVTYGVYAGYTFNWEVWLERHGVKVALINGSQYSDRCFEMVRSYYSARRSARELGWRQ